MRGSRKDRTRWERVRELSEYGVPLTTTAKIVGVHHTTAIYIGRKLGLKWTPARGNQEPAQRVERLMRLACK